MVQCSD